MFTQVGDTFAIRPMAALRPSKQIRNDEDLSWEEMMDAKNVMLHFMAKSGAWEDEHATALASFYINLDYHQQKEQKNGKLALLLYQSRVWQEWFDTLRRNEGFNILLIEEDLLCSLVEEVNTTVQDRENAIRDREVEQVCHPPAARPRIKLTELTFSPLHAPYSFYTLPLYAARVVLCHTHPACCCYFATCHLPIANCRMPFSTLCTALAMIPLCAMHRQ